MRRFLFIMAWGLLVFVILPRMLWTTRAGEMPPTVTDLTHLLQPGKHRLSLGIDDHVRKVIFYTPKGFKPGVARPIVFFFHGAGGTAEQAYRTYDWPQKADAENFFAVFPEGLAVRPGEDSSFLLNPRIWRDERSGRQASKINDVHFFEELLNRLQAALPSDSRHIYATGFSNGAAMTFTLGSHFPERIAAIAPVSSQSFSNIEALARPMPVYFLAGTADPLIPYEGGTVTLPWGTTRTTPPVQESVDAWARLDGCPPEPQVAREKDGVRVLRYGPGREGAEVVFTTVEGNGHHWPGSIEPLPNFISGPSLDPFRATDRIWDFFAAHPMPGAK